MSSVAFPATAALISLACLLVVARDALRRPKPDKAAWLVAFALFAAAAGIEVVGAATGWTPLLARAYYLSGAVLVVGFLALGQLYLLFPRQLAAAGPGAALLVVAIAAALVAAAPVDQPRLAADGWHALRRDGALRAVTIALNAGGALVVVAGSLLSAWRFRRRGTHRHRMIGCLLIALGTLTVGTGGTLTRLGRPEYLYAAMAAGIALIFAGYLQARRPHASRPAAAPPITQTDDAATTVAALEPRPAFPADPVPHPSLPPLDPAVAFIEGALLPLDDHALGESVRVWSVDRAPVDRFDRDQARLAWALRLRLSPAGQRAFDAHSVPARLQLVQLYHDVLTPPPSPTADTASAQVEPRATTGARLTELSERHPAVRGAG